MSNEYKGPWSSNAATQWQDGKDLGLQMRDGAQVWVYVGPSGKEYHTPYDPWDKQVSQTRFASDRAQMPKDEWEELMRQMHTATMCDCRLTLDGA